MPSPVNLFTLASTQARWLSARQTAVAGNIANVNTPGFRARDVEPFSKMLEGGSGVSLVSTSAAHFHSGATGGIGTKEIEGGRILPSGNNVALEDEFVKAGEVRREFELNTAIVRAFHRMLLTAAKG